ncbi:QRFP-like peptide receptor [Nematostella vectensis]|uniref:QRFP-like peptide receptor n=1 Tax=Nematostella vectensis TaxID=45351 RepID=UPI00138FA842|nr:QRFP-like peptide receptor [Nematostella vectensis]
MLNLTYNKSTPIEWVSTEITASERIAKIVVCFLIILTALVGNVLIIVVVCRNANMRKTINYFIVNMAVSDLAVSLFVLPRVISENITSYEFLPEWRVSGAAGEVLCKLVYFISDLSPAVSILSLVCITLDRFCAVVFPMKRTLITSRVRLVLIVFTWLFSAAFFSPSFYTMRLVGISGLDSVYCRMRWSKDRAQHVVIHRAYITATCILFVITPMVLITVMYTVIMVVVRMALLTRQSKQGSAAQRRRQDNNNRLLRLAVLTVISFTVCWGPYNIYLFLQSFAWKWKQSSNVHGARVLFEVVVFLTYTNSMINPCLYFVFIENYRHGLRRVLRSAHDARRNIPSATRLDGRLRTQHTELYCVLSKQLNETTASNVPEIAHSN